jgi:uncharacterized protein YaeQ
MALTATIFRFRIALSDVDRGVYDELDLRVAQHPSESVPFMLTRVLAYALEVVDGMAFSRGVSLPEEPTVFARDPTGALTLWIEIGSPAPERLHKAAKACDVVKVYTHKNPETLVRQCQGQKIHRLDEIELWSVPTELLTPLEDKLDRQVKWSLTRTDGELYVDTGDETITARLTRLPWST